MKKLLSIMLALLLAAAPLGVLAENAVQPKLVADDVTLDTDGSDGYSGDYVVIYNPNTNANGAGLSTGNMSGLIETNISANTAPAASAEATEPYMIDVDAKFAEQAKKDGITRESIKVPVNDGGYRFEVGDTMDFSITSYSPLPDWTIEFKVLAKGEHCYIWTPTSTDPNVHPLDGIDPSYGAIAAAEFDSKFDLMQASFGDHENGAGDGRLNILYYNIHDGWQLGQGYVGGYFSPWDFFTNQIPCLHIDTYPGVHYTAADGTEINDISRTYNVMVHEYQHLINFSNTENMETWENECMSAAAEEICYPGSSISRRIMSWTNYDFADGNWFDPPEEYRYNPAYLLHNGYSMYEWDNNMSTDNILVLYAQVSLFAQYIFSQYGNGTFRQLLAQDAQGRAFPQAFQNVTGRSAAEFVKNFRIALTANTAQNVLGGVYGFKVQEGYDPAQYHGVQNLYSWLGPVVFTGSQCSIKSGGAITVKPVGGVYNPPAGASSGLVYVGVTRNTSSQPNPYEKGDVDLNGSVQIADAVLALRNVLGLIQLTQQQLEIGDMDNSGSVNVADAVSILRRAMGLRQLSK